MQSRPLALAAALLLAHPALAVPARLAPTRDAATGSRTFRLWDGTSASVGPDGFLTRTEDGKPHRGGRRLPVYTPPGADDLSLLRMLSLPVRGIATQRAVPGAGGNFWAASMTIEPRSLEGHAPLALAPLRAAPMMGVPSNYGVRTSLQAHLNAAGVDAMGAFNDLARRFGQLPGQGVRITNVSVGDLTDQAMADAGDFYVQLFGPTSRVINGQRYLDYPSLPLIPTWTADARGNLDPVGTVEFVDPYLSEVLLDFSVMAPLPSDLQRPEARGDGLTDLLGIAPGASYRLVVPSEPTIANIYVALQAAANQQPRPDVITASLGFGFDGIGFPGRYLEDDPVGQAVVAGIVSKGIVVCISSNDGTRLYTPTAIGPDGGSAATDRLLKGQTPTSTADDYASTIATRVADSGAIAVGGTTLDDIFSAPPQAGGPLSRVGQFPETRYNGAASFSSGFGTRIDIAAPSDGIVALAHICTQYPCTPQDAIPVLSGGTSASAPMTAAAAAVVIQGARLMKKKLTPLQIRDILVRTGRPLSQPPQADRVLSMGPQLDVTAALESVIGTDGAPSIARVSISHRRELGDLGAAFRSDADPSNIDLSGPLDGNGNNSGQWLVGPITISADVVNASSGLQYALVVGSTEIVQDGRAFRLMPSELMAAAGVPVISSDPRNVDFRVEIRRAGTAIASASSRVVFGPSDGLITEPLAPVAPAVATEGSDVVVHYDLSGLRYLDSPTLIVSGIGHWSPTAAPLFHEDTSIALKRTSGDVAIPASAFRGGAGLYGIAIHPQASQPDIGQVAVIRIAARVAGRPDAPTIAAGSGAFGHGALVTRASPQFTVRWDASSVGDGAMLEFSAPAPTLRASWNTWSNANGSRPDGDGVDSPSTLVVALPGSSGTKAFDAVKLGLPSGIFYSVRVLATRGGAPVGEASPSSSLEYDDVALPDGLVTSFDLAGETSSIGAITIDSFGNLTGTTLGRWSPSSATLGATISSDPTGNTVYEAIGTDASAHISLAARWPWFDTTQTLETWDTGTGRLLGSLNVDMFAEDWLFAYRVDAARHRAAFLAFDPNFAPVVLPFDLKSTSFGAPVAAPQDGSFYNLLTLDPSSGKVFITASSVTDFCLFRSGPLTSVDLNTGATASAAINSCATTMVADGKNVHVAEGPMLSNGVLLPVARLQNVNENAMKATPAVYPGPRSPAFTEVDAVNGVLVVAYIAGGDVYVNSNATSGVGVYDLPSGKLISYASGFGIADVTLGGGALSPIGLRGMQLDPKTRTGWIIGAGLTQLQKFSY